MWNVDPKLLCRKHLLGEHLEMHMFINAIREKKSIAGYLANGLVEPERIVKRHNELAREMQNRGYHHRSDVSEEDARIVEEYSAGNEHSGHVNVERSIRDLLARCNECAQRMKVYGPWESEEK